jgi:hypothetical protein
MQGIHRKERENRKRKTHLTHTIIATQVLGDLVNAFMGDVVRGGIGSPIAVALLVYLLRSEIRSAFASGNSRSVR